MYHFHIFILRSLPSLAVIAGLLLLRAVGGLQSLELAAFDRLMRSRPLEKTDNRVVVIGIQESDLQQLKTYPVTDQVLAETIQTVSQFKPAAIGVDLFRSFAVPPGERRLARVVKDTPNLFMVYSYAVDDTGTKITVAPFVPLEKRGLVDVPLDLDGNVRRLLFGFQDAEGQNHIALFMQLSMAWWEQQPPKIKLKEPEFSFLPTADFGGYHQLDNNGDQIMLNPRNHPQAFRQFSLQDVRSGKLRSVDVQGKVVLIGLTATSVKDVVNSGMFPKSNNGLVNGLEVQAHAVSQVMDWMSDRRPLIRSWHESGEVMWIVGWGLIGLLVGRFSRNVWQMLLGLSGGVVAIGGVSYGLLVMGWWVPLLPGLLVFGVNGGGFLVAMVYQRERDLRLRLRDRQQVLEDTFTAVHNGPLQDLSGLMRQIQDRQIAGDLPMADQLQRINQDLRQIFTVIQKEIVTDLPSLAVSSEMDLNKPLHELLQQVYDQVCENELTGLQGIAIKIIQFNPLLDEQLTMVQKRSACRFLEEALWNVGKHARSATKLWVSCGCEGNRQMIVVKDNGAAGMSKKMGEGSKQAKRLAKQLRGQFKRYPNQPKGVVCQMVW